MAVVNIFFSPWPTDLYAGFRAYLYDAYQIEGYARPEHVGSFLQAMADIDFMEKRARTNATIFARNPVGWNYDLRRHVWDDYMNSVRAWYGVDISVRLECVKSEAFGVDQYLDAIAVVAEEDRAQMQSLLADHPGVYLREDGALMPTPYAMDGRSGDIKIYVHIEESDLGLPVDLPLLAHFGHNYSVVKVGTSYLQGGHVDNPWTSERITKCFYAGQHVSTNCSGAIRHTTDEATDLLYTTGTQNAAATRCIVPTERQIQAAAARGNAGTKGRVILLDDAAPTTTPIPRDHMVLLPHPEEKGKCCNMPVLALGLNTSRTGFIPWQTAVDKVRAALPEIPYDDLHTFWTAPFDRVMVQRTANGWNAVIALALPVSLREYWKPDKSHPQMLYAAYTVTLSHTFQELNEERHRYRNLPGELIEAIYGNRTLSAFLQQILLTIQGIPKALARHGGDFDNFSLRGLAEKAFKLPKGHLLRSFGPMFSYGFREFCKVPRGYDKSYGKRRMAKIAYDLLSQTDTALCLKQKVEVVVEEVVQAVSPRVSYRHLEV